MKDNLSPLQQEWEEILKKAGMPSKLPSGPLGKKVSIGLGVKTEGQERLEDRGGHSPICPIVLGSGISEKIDQPNDRPVEDEVIG